jgi:Flp pilus assembly pilin Flp
VEPPFQAATPVSTGGMSAGKPAWPAGGRLYAFQVGPSLWVEGLTRHDTSVARFLREDDGIETVEYVLLVAFIALPLFGLVPYLLNGLRNYFHLISFTVALPFP